MSSNVPRPERNTEYLIDPILSIAFSLFCCPSPTYCKPTLCVSYQNILSKRFYMCRRWGALLLDRAEGRWTGVCDFCHPYCRQGGGGGSEGVIEEGGKKRHQLEQSQILRTFPCQWVFVDHVSHRSLGTLASGSSFKFFFDTSILPPDQTTSLQTLLSPSSSSCSVWGRSMLILWSEWTLLGTPNHTAVQCSTGTGRTRNIWRDIGKVDIRKTV